MSNVALRIAQGAAFYLKNLRDRGPAFTIPDLSYVRVATVPISEFEKRAFKAPSGDLCIAGRFTVMVYGKHPKGFHRIGIWSRGDDTAYVVRFHPNWLNSDDLTGLCQALTTGRTDELMVSHDPDGEEDQDLAA